MGGLVPIRETPFDMPAGKLMGKTVLRLCKKN